MKLTEEQIVFGQVEKLLEMANEGYKELESIRAKVVSSKNKGYCNDARKSLRQAIESLSELKSSIQISGLDSENSSTVADNG